APIVVARADNRLPALSSGIQTVFLDRVIGRIAAEDDGAFEVPALPENLAYVMYTSGSTGRPKGVAIPRAAVVRLLFETDYIELRPDDRVAQIANASFDAATFEVWGALLHGGVLVGISRETTLEPRVLARALAERQVTAAFITVALFNRVAQVLRDLPETFRGLRHLLVGGEALDPGTVRGTLERGRPDRFLNVYGPTESTTFATWQTVHTVDVGTASLPIGQPVGNTTAHVLDADLRLVPFGVLGELFLGGDGLARGYLKRPDLTAERFVPSPFAAADGKPGQRLYRTGDVVRRRPGGEIDFIGRRDGQIKVRGFRIEIGEVEAALLAGRDISAAAVVARELPSGERGLIAFVVGEDGDSVDGPALRARLAERLPDYMVPAAFVALAALPLNVNGKVDRRALEQQPLDLAEVGAAAGREPSTPEEEIVAGVWAEVLGLERVGAEDDFFALGGHSLLATRIVSRARELFRVELPLRCLFETPTVAGLAAAIVEARSAGLRLELPPIEAAPRAADIPLSFSQERLWFLDRLSPGASTLNMRGSVRLAGRLDVAALAQSFARLVQRHESLRTRFEERTDSEVTVVQAIDPPDPLRPLPLADLAALAEDRRESEANRLAAAEAERPFDLARGPLFRTCLLRLEAGEHRVLLTIHHVVSDGWSMGILVREMGVLYGAFVAGEAPPLAPLAVQYADFAIWQRARLGAVLDAQLHYWRERLEGLPPALELPLDRPRPAVQTFRGAGESLLLSPRLAASLRRLAQGSGASIFMTLLAGFGMLLGRLAGEEDLAVGTPIAGRHRPETEGLIGFFLNSLVLRFELGGNPSFRELVARVRETALGAYAHQDLPFERLLEALNPERDLSRTPLFQVFFNMVNLPLPSLRLADLAILPLDLPEPESKFDLTVYAREVESGIHLGWTYNADLFDAPRVREMMAQYRAILEQATAAPERPICEISLLTAAARAVLPDPAAPLGVAWRGAVHDLFRRKADAAPERLAIIDEDGAWTYGDLAAVSGRLAAALAAAGVERGDAVAIYAHRSAPVAAGVL